MDETSNEEIFEGINNEEDITCKYCGEKNLNRLEAHFCIYCGKPLFNFCTNNQCDINSLDDKAAFCYKCGNPSLFSDYGIVSPKYIYNDNSPF